MVAVMADRKEFRRLDSSLHAAEEALRAWGAHYMRDRAEVGFPRQAPFYNAMHKEWLDAARSDPHDESPYMLGLVSFYQSQKPTVQAFMRYRWAYGRTTDQARARLGMSAYAADKLVRQIREQVARSVTHCVQV